jgi:DNA-binding beta-propeller fold protein YncE
MRRLLLATAAALALAPVSAAQGAYVPAGGWGSLGSGAGQFGSGVIGPGANRQWDDPAGIAVSGGTVYVVDTSNNRVQRFTRDGRYLGRFGYRAQDKGSIALILPLAFFQPEGVAVGPGGLYVVDSGNDRVMVRTPTGGFVRRISRHGSRGGQFVQPWGIAVGGGRVFVADQGNYRISRFSPGGAYLGSFSRFGRGPGQLVHPYGVATRGGTVYVTDHIRNRLMMFTASGRFLREVGRPGTGPGEFRRPAGVALGPDGSVFVAERCNRRIQRFTAGGGYLETLGQNTLIAPTFLAVDSSGMVFVSDHHRVVRFAPRSGLRRPASSPASAASHNGVNIQCRHVA